MYEACLPRSCCTTRTTASAAFARRGERGRHVHCQDGVVLRVVEKRPQRGPIAARIGVPNDVDRVRFRPCGRKHGVELRQGRRRKAGERSAEIDDAVDREHADAAAIGHDGEALALEGAETPERLGGREQFVEVEHAQQAGPTESRGVDRVDPRERAGVGGRGARGLNMAAGLHHDHRLHARGGAGRRHELAHVGDRLDVHQDRPGLAVEGEIIEEIAEIDIERVADRDRVHTQYLCDPRHLS